MYRFAIACVVVCAACSSSGSGFGGAPGGPDAPPCVARTCDGLSANCGTLDDGCGSQLDCGTCNGPAVCAGQGQANVCAIPLDARTCVDGWCWEAPWPMPYQPNAAATVSASDVWAVGLHGFVEHFDGSSWQPVAAGTTEDLNGIWMASVSDGWLVGNAGTVRRWNGTTWTAVTSGTTANLRGVSGTADGTVWAVGDQVTLRWNGTAWRSAAVSSPMLEHVYAAGNGSVIATSFDYLWQLVGATWNKVSDDPPFLADYALYGVAGVGNTVYAGGALVPIFGDNSPTLEQWNGLSWDYIPQNDSTSDIFYEVYSDGNHVYGVTEQAVSTLDAQAVIANQPPDGSKLGLVTGIGDQLFDLRSAAPPWQYQQGTWTSSSYGSYTGLATLGVVGDSVWFGGSAGQVLEWNAGLVGHALATHVDGMVLSVAGRSRDTMLALVGDYVVGGYDLYQRSGQQWSSVDMPFGALALHVGADPDDVIALGDAIYHRVVSGPNGVFTDWPQDAVAGPTAATGITWRAAADAGDDVVAVGDEPYASPPVPHVALRHAGAWTALPTPAGERLCGVAATAADDIWVAGYDGVGAGEQDFPADPYDPTDDNLQGTVSHWDGTAWTTIELPGAVTLCAIAVAGGEVWTSGELSPLYHRAADGTWDTSWPLYTGWIRALGVAGGSVWLAGDAGAVLRRPISAP